MAGLTSADDCRHAGPGQLGDGFFFTLEGKQLGIDSRSRALRSGAGGSGWECQEESCSSSSSRLRIIGS